MFIRRWQSWVVVVTVATSCGGELFSASGSDSTSGDTTVSATTLTSFTTTSVSASSTVDPSMTTSADETLGDSSDTGTCPVGGGGCPCTGGGSCDPGLECVDEVCNDPRCPIGSPGCPCTRGGACDGGLECMAGDCVDPGGTEGCPIGAAGCPCTGGGACDPGLVCEGDYCVDQPASTSAGSGGESESTTSPVSAGTESTGGDACGNGLIDGNEDCDDGDDIQGNGCNNDCVSSGTELWTLAYAGPDGLDDEARRVAVGSGDAFVVTGIRSVVGAGHDILTRKYDSDGGLIWERSHGGADNDHDEAWGVAIDDDDNVVIAGSVYEGALREAWLRKYDVNGVEQWTRTYAGVLEASAFAVAVDQVGDLVVGGYASAIGESENTWIRKYTVDGDVSWTIVEDQGVGLHDNTQGVHTNSADSIIVVGNISLANGSQGWARGYDADGGLLWSDTPADTRGLRGISTNAADEAFTGGRSEAGQAQLQKLAADGDPMWTQTYAPNGGTADVLDLAVDSTGAIVICGIDQTAADFRIFVRKYGANGSAFWTRTYAGFVSGIVAELGWSVAIDGQDNIIVVGYEQVAGQNDWWIRKYTP